MRVLHLVAIPQLTGAAEPVLDFVTGLRALGVDAALQIDTRRDGNFAQILATRGISVGRELVLSTQAGPVAAIGDWWKLRAQIQGYDLVHTHLSHDHTLAVLARGSATRPKLVRTIHAARAMAPGAGRHYLFQKSDRITVASSQDRQRLLAGHGLDAHKVVVIGGSVDAARFHPDPAARVRVRASLGVRDDHILLGSVARFQAGRRHELMLEALAAARRKTPNLRLALIGHGETEAELRARVQSLGLSDAVLFPGYRKDDLNDYLVALDAALWLVPGNDATSRAVLQAMAAGLPVIGGRSGAIADAVLEGETGCLVADDDAEALAQAMLALVDPQRRAAQAERARARVLALYTPELRAQALLSVYKAVLEPS